MNEELTIVLKQNGFLIINKKFRYLDNRRIYKIKIDESIRNIIIVCPFNDVLKGIVAKNSEITRPELCNLIQDSLLNMNFSSFETSVGFVDVHKGKINFSIIGSDIDLLLNDVPIDRNDDLYFGMKDVSGSTIFNLARVDEFKSCNSVH